GRQIANRVASAPTVEPVVPGPLRVSPVSSEPPLVRMLRDGLSRISIQSNVLLEDLKNDPQLDEAQLSRLGFLVVEFQGLLLHGFNGGESLLAQREGLLRTTAVDDYAVLKAVYKAADLPELKIDIAEKLLNSPSPAVGASGGRRLLLSRTRQNVSGITE